MNKRNIQYCLLQCGFWLLFAACCSFAALFLRSRGISAAMTGVITAAFGGISALLQPVLGRLADRSPKVGWRGMVLLTALLSALCALALMLILAELPTALLFGLLLLLASVMMPFVNAASFYYQARGENVNFGMARGLGSLSCAGMALVMGKVADAVGTVAVPASALLFALVILVCAWVMPQDGAPSQTTERAEGDKHGFFARYPSFALMFAASVFMLTFHNMTNTYLIDMMSSVGGGSNELGIALAIAALMEPPVMFLFSCIVRFYSPSRLMLFSAIGFAAKAVVYILAGSITMMYAAQVIQLISFAVFASASVYYARDAVAEEDRITGQAYMTSTITLGTVLGNLLGGALIDAAGLPAMLYTAFAITLGGIAFSAMAQKAGAKK